MRGFEDRSQAGRTLAQLLTSLAGGPETLVLALPRGGVPVAFEIARALNAELDVLVVRKLGVPGSEELAMGAITADGIQVLNYGLIQHLRISPGSLATVIAFEERELKRRERVYRQGRPSSYIRGRTVILVDDGLATGATMRAAIKYVLAASPQRIIVAAPVAERDTFEQLQFEGVEVVAAALPKTLGSVGVWYNDFTPVSDDEVCRLLDRAAHDSVAEAAGPDVALAAKYS
jgi:predicted phosphoribosyltransferase